MRTAEIAILCLDKNGKKVTDEVLTMGGRIFTPDDEGIIYIPTCQGCKSLIAYCHC